MQRTSNSANCLLWLGWTPTYPLARLSEAGACTNSILCLKKGADRGALHPDWVNNCSKHFLRPLIEIIQPKLVVCLGQDACKAVLGAYGQTVGNFRVFEREAPFELPGGRKMVAVYHCGRTILNTHRKLDAQQRDWQRIGRFFRQTKRVRTIC